MIRSLRQLSLSLTVDMKNIYLIYKFLKSLNYYTKRKCQWIMFRSPSSQDISWSSWPRGNFFDTKGKVKQYKKIKMKISWRTNKWTLLIFEAYKNFEFGIYLNVDDTLKIIYILRGISLWIIINSILSLPSVLLFCGF